ncbi:MAG: methyltransferase domain-containing protein [Bacteroidota bacterium]
MDEGKNEGWFENWFDSPYYHILYKHRDFCEAELFIDNLINYLEPKSGSKFLDLGCGRGRHSVYLNKKGYDVIGSDLSPANIKFASQFENEHLRFCVADMRKIPGEDQFDYVLNLFTSFGYFENEGDNYDTIKCVSKVLKQKGIFVLDFMNVEKVIAHLVVHEIKIIDDIEFNITRRIENNFIVKHIKFSDQGKEFNFQERVKAITLNDFKNYFDANKLKILHLFSNYNLEKFDLNTSNRLIIIGQKE